jgi:small-conductance mechanosensitive channel
MSIKSIFLIAGTKHASLFLFVMICVSFCMPTFSSGQATTEADLELTGIQQSTAPVKVDGNILFYVRGISSFPAQQRAATISKRIRTAAADPSISKDSVRVIAGENLVKIYAGNEFIMNIYKVDAEVEGVNLETIADVFHQKIWGAIDAYRHSRSRPVLVKNLLFALGYSLLMILVLFTLLWIIRRIITGLENRIRSRVDTVSNKSYSLIRSDQIWKVYYILFKTLKIILIVVTIGVFSQRVLSLFPWTNNLASSALKLFMDPLVIIGNGFISYLPSLVFLIVIFLVTRYLLKLVEFFFSGIGGGVIVIKDFQPEWAIPTFKIMRVFIIAFAVVIAYPYIPGSESNAFKGVTVFLGVLFSLGSSSFIGNVIAGYTMIYRRAFTIGDRIQVGDQVGFVEEQKLLTTRLRSPKNEDIIIPNSILLNSEIINYSASAKEHGLILHTTVGIGYETPWRMVDAMLKTAAYRTEGLLKDPPPYVLKKKLGDFAVEYEINAYCNDVSRILHYYSILHQNILDLFNENNIQIMTPAYEGDPEIPKVVPRDQWDIPLANESKVK